MKRGIFIDAEKLDVKLPDPKDTVFYEIVMEKRKKDEAFSGKAFYCHTERDVDDSGNGRLNLQNTICSLERKPGACAFFW